MGQMQFEKSLNGRPIESLSPKERRLLGLIADVAERAIRRAPPFENIDLEPIKAYPSSSYWVDGYWNKLDEQQRNRLFEDTISVAKAEVAGPLFSNPQALANVRALEAAILARQRELGIEWCADLYSPDFERRKIGVDLLASLGFDYDAEIGKSVGTFTAIQRTNPNCYLAIYSPFSAVYLYVGFREPFYLSRLGDFFYERLSPEWENEEESQRIFTGLTQVANVVLGELAKALDNSL